MMCLQTLYSNLCDILLMETIVLSGIFKMPSGLPLFCTKLTLKQTNKYNDGTKDPFEMISIDPAFAEQSDEKKMTQCITDHFEYIENGFSPLPIWRGVLL